MHRALAFIALMFFVCGFALGLNPILVPVLQQSLGVTSFQSYWIVAASFVPFLLWGYPAQRTILALGYKRTMALAFLIFAAAFGVYACAAATAGFALYLAASFLSGTANAFLQATINPYVTILGPRRSAARRISLMGICNKLAWPLPSLFIVWLIGKQVADLAVADLYTPFFILIAITLALALACLLIPLPDIRTTTAGDAEAPRLDATDDSPYAASKTSVWQFPHLWLGALALFLYVGVETVSLSTAVDYAVGLGLPHPDRYAWIAPVGMTVGYLFGVVAIPRWISQAAALRLCSAVAILGSILVPTLPPQLSIWALALLALGCSLMWPAIWPLASADLGRFAPQGNSLLTMSIAGGAVVPTLFGLLNDLNAALAGASLEAGAVLSGAAPALHSHQASYWICLPCFLFILYYGLSGHKLRR